MSAAPDFVVQIHSALAVRYGRRWLAMWAGLDMELVRADWRRQLQEFADKPAAVIHALDNLPELVPTATDFRALCRAAPKPAWQPLPPPATSERGKQAMRDLVARARAEGAMGARGTGWSARVLQRAARGEVISPTVRDMACGVRRRTDEQSDGADALSKTGLTGKEAPC